MKSKKFAMILFICVVAFGFVLSSVQAAAKESKTVTGSAVSVASSATTEKNAEKKEEKKEEQKPSYSESELRLMSSIIYCEAGIESYQGKLAVGIVIMNRIASKAFPNTLHKVIYQRRQFSPVRNGMLKKRLAEYDAGKTKDAEWQDCIRAAKSVLEGQDYITYKGKKKNMKSFHFFSVYLSGARFRLGGHRFK